MLRTTGLGDLVSARSREHRIYCGDAGHGAIDVYGYPGGKYLYSYTAGLSANALVTGVAPDPPRLTGAGSDL